MVTLAVMVVLVVVVVPMVLMLGSAYLIAVACDPSTRLGGRLRGIETRWIARRACADLDREYEQLTRQTSESP